MNARITLVTQKLKTLNWWDVLNSSAVLSLGVAVARLLGFAFSLVLARTFTPDKYGYVQYMIALAGIIAIGTQAFTQHVLARTIARYKTDPAHLHEELSNFWIILIVLTVGTLGIASLLLLISGRFNYGVLVVFMGMTIFYAYYGLARGFLANFKLMVAYVGSNLVQIIATIIFVALPGSQSTFLALFIYGTSYIPPLLVLYFASPFPISLKLAAPRRDIAVPMVRSSVPLWISHVCFMVGSVIDVLLLERYHGEATVGVYALSKTLCAVFVFVPMAINVTLMPKIAALPAHEHMPLLRRALIAHGTVSGALLVITIASYQWVVENVFGAKYSVEPQVFISVAVGSVVVYTHSIISAALVGKGHNRVEMLSRIAGLVASVVTGLVLVPNYGALGAGLCMLAGGIASLAALVVLRQPQKKGQEPEPEQPAEQPAVTS